MAMLWGCILWVFCSATVATLPLRLQYWPGAILLGIAPVLIVMIGIQVGWIFALPALAALLSMYRNPLRILFAKLLKANRGVTR